MYSERDWTKAVSKLIQLTVNRAIRWNLGQFRDDDDKRDARMFYGHHQGKTYVVRAYERKTWLDETDFSWSTDFDFEIWEGDNVHPLQQRIATSPRLAALVDLFATVEAQFAQDQNALGFLLAD